MSTKLSKRSHSHTWLQEKYFQFKRYHQWFKADGVTCADGTIYQLTTYKLIFNSTLVVTIDQATNFQGKVLVVRMHGNYLLYAKIVDGPEVVKAIYDTINVQGKVDVSELKQEDIRESVMPIAILKCIDAWDLLPT